MAKIKPFKGLRYNQHKVGDIAKVTIPPYDIISEDQQNYFYDLNPYNSIRLELPKELAGEGEIDNKYIRAGNTLKDWINNDILIRDKEDCFYIYQQEFNLKGKEKYLRTGIIGLVELVEFDKGIVLPHENTLSKPKADRLELMRHCDSNFSQVFGLYDDPKGSVPKLIADYITSHEPDVLVKDGAVSNSERLWVVSDPYIIAKMESALKDKQIYIADGHHRYETGLAYRDEQKSKNPNHRGDELYNYIMMTLVEMDDPGLLILPTHRMLKGMEVQMKTLIDKLDKNFHIREIPMNRGEGLDKANIIQNVLQDEGLHTFILYGHPGESLFILKPKSLEPMNKMHPHRHDSYIDLDVSILHSLILEDILGIGEKELANQEYLEYTHSIDEAVKNIDAGIQEMGFFLSATTIRQIQAVSLANEKMPQKSTYFYPKLLTGLVFNMLS